MKRKCSSRDTWNNIEDLAQEYNIPIHMYRKKGIGNTGRSLACAKINAFLEGAGLLVNANLPPTLESESLLTAADITDEEYETLGALSRQMTMAVKNEVKPAAILAITQKSADNSLLDAVTNLADNAGSYFFFSTLVLALRNFICLGFPLASRKMREIRVTSYKIEDMFVTASLDQLSRSISRKWDTAKTVEFLLQYLKTNYIPLISAALVTKVLVDKFEEVFALAWHSIGSIPQAIFGSVPLVGSVYTWFSTNIRDACSSVLRRAFQAMLTLSSGAIIFDLFMRGCRDNYYEVVWPQSISILHFLTGVVVSRIKAMAPTWLDPHKYVTDYYDETFQKLTEEENDPNTTKEEKIIISAKKDEIKVLQDIQTTVEEHGVPVEKFGFSAVAADKLESHDETIDLKVNMKCLPDKKYATTSADCSFFMPKDAASDAYKNAVKWLRGYYYLDDTGQPPLPQSKVTINMPDRYVPISKDGTSRPVVLVPPAVTQYTQEYHKEAAEKFNSLSIWWKLAEYWQKGLDAYGNDKTHFIYDWARVFDGHIFNHLTREEKKRLFYEKIVPLVPDREINAKDSEITLFALHSHPQLAHLHDYVLWELPEGDPFRERLINKTGGSVKFLVHETGKWFTSFLPKMPWS